MRASESYDIFDRLGVVATTDPGESRERELFSRYAACPTEELRSMIVAAYIRLVLSIAKKYRRSNPRIDLDDLVQEGMIGLIWSIDRFDVRRGFRFSTYAIYWIKQRVIRFVDKQAYAHKIPAGRVQALNIVSRKIEALTQELGRKLTLDEILQIDGISPADVEDYFTVGDVVSLDGPVGEGDGIRLEELLPVTDSYCVFAEVDTSFLAELLMQLKPREREVIELRFGLTDGPFGRQQVANRLNITREGVRLIELRALRKMRNSSVSAEPS